MVYLLCFDKKFKHAKHYIGFAVSQDSFERRLKCHTKGTGSRLMDAVTKAGIGFKVARTWADGDRNFERKLKNRKKSAELCPLCIERAKREKVLATEAKVIEKMNQPPIVCPVVTSFQDKPMSPDLSNMLVKAKEISNAQPQSNPNPSRWERVRNSLARFWQLFSA